jgi:hypothetical protein
MSRGVKPHSHDCAGAPKIDASPRSVALMSFRIPKFAWNADPDKIIAARKRGFQMMESIHSECGNHNSY